MRPGRLIGTKISDSCLGLLTNYKQSHSGPPVDTSLVSVDSLVLVEHRDVKSCLANHPVVADLISAGELQR